MPKTFLNQPEKTEVLRPLLPEVIDILVFGSSVKGKLFPRDVDVAVLVEEDQRQNVADRLRAMTLPPGFEVEFLTPASLEQNPLLALSLFHEGVSLKFGRFAEAVGLAPGCFYFYRLAGKTKSEKNRFLHALNRMVQDRKMFKMTAAVVFVPVDAVSEFDSFLAHWQVENSSVRVLLPRPQLEGLVLASPAVDRKQMMEKQAEASR